MSSPCARVAALLEESAPCCSRDSSPPLAALALSLPVALAAAPACASSPGQRVDLKVLLISADGSEPGFGAWKAALDREGVPYDTVRTRRRRRP